MHQHPDNNIAKMTTKRITTSISITSGKGGVGKTSLSINLCCSLADIGKKVLLLDCDFGLANVDVMLNLTAHKTLEDILQQKSDINEVVVKSNYGFDVLPASSGIPDIADLDMGQQKFLLQQLSRVQDNYDFLIFDTGSGIHKSILRINAAVDKIIVVTNPEPTSLTDAYALIKSLRKLYKVQLFYLVVMKANYRQAEAIKTLLQNVAIENGVQISLQILGAVPDDDVVRNGVYQRKPWSKINVRAKAINELANISNLLVNNKLDAPSRPNRGSIWGRWFSSFGQ